MAKKTLTPAQQTAMVDSEIHARGLVRGVRKEMLKGKTILALALASVTVGFASSTGSNVSDAIYGKFKS